VQPGDTGPAGLPVPFNTFQTTSFNGDLHRASWDWIGQRMVNHFSFGVNTFDKDAFSPNVGQDWRDRVCIPNAVDCNDNLGNITFTELSQWGGPSNNGTEQPRLAVKNDFTLTARSHLFKMGFTFDRQQANGFGQQDIGGRAGFSFRGTSVPAAATLAAGGGSSFASFLLGVADSGRTETVRYLQQVYSYSSFYAQDDWRLSPKLVLNYGVRYEFTKPPVAGGDQYSDFSPTTPNPAVNGYPGALIFAGEGQGRTGSRTLVPGYYGAWGPRVSFAYSADPRTTIRGGVGRSFGRVTVTQSSSHFAGFIGQYVFSTADSGSRRRSTSIRACPRTRCRPGSIRPSRTTTTWTGFLGQEASRPAVYDSWTLSMQRELRQGLTVEVDYNGVYGSHLQAALINPNQVPMSVVNDLVARYGPIGAVIC
jgi:outer membrane receptor protein involved in Fe transport